MTDTTAFSATFSDMRQVKGRKVYQLTFEVPAEKVDEALQVLGGAPHSEKEVWCGIARIKQKEALTSEPEQPRQETRTGGAPKRRFDELPYSQQAALASSDPVFRAYITERYGYDGSITIAEFIRNWCGVESRAFIKPGTVAAEYWMGLWRSFETWRMYDKVVP